MQNAIRLCCSAGTLELVIFIQIWINFLDLKILEIKQWQIEKIQSAITAWKVSVFIVFLVRSISPYSVRMRKNTDQKNSEYERLSHSVFQTNVLFPWKYQETGGYLDVFSCFQEVWRENVDLKYLMEFCFNWIEWYPKAFYKVWPEGLVYKLNSMRISGKFYRLIESYISKWFQRVVSNGQTSSWRIFVVLGPLRFLMY